MSPGPRLCACVSRTVRVLSRSTCSHAVGRVDRLLRRWQGRVALPSLSGGLSPCSRREGLLVWFVPWSYRSPMLRFLPHRVLFALVIAAPRARAEAPAWLVALLW